MTCCVARPLAGGTAALLPVFASEAVNFEALFAFGAVAYGTADFGEPTTIVDRVNARGATYDAIFDVWSEFGRRTSAYADAALADGHTVFRAPDAYTRAIVEDACDVPAAARDESLELGWREHQVVKPRACVAVPADPHPQPAVRDPLEVGIVDPAWIDAVGDDPRVLARDREQAAQEPRRALRGTCEAEVTRLARAGGLWIRAP